MSEIILKHSAQFLAEKKMRENSWKYLGENFEVCIPASSRRVSRLISYFGTSDS